MNDNNAEKPKQGFDKEDFMSALFHPDVPFNYKLAFVLSALIYTVMPIDILPDFLGIFGFADDVGLVMIAAQTFTHFANRYLKQQYRGEKGDPDTIIIEDEPQSYGAQSAQNTRQGQGNQNRPHLPESHLRRHGQNNQIEDADYRPVQRTQGQQPPPDNNAALYDERHEKLIRAKQQASDTTFNDLLRARDAEAEQDESDWDFSRNDPFAKKRGGKKE